LAVTLLRFERAVLSINLLGMKESLESLDFVNKILDGVAAGEYGDEEQDKKLVVDRCQAVLDSLLANDVGGVTEAKLAMLPKSLYDTPFFSTDPNLDDEDDMETQKRKAKAWGLPDLPEAGDWVKVVNGQMQKEEELRAGRPRAGRLPQ